MKKRLYKRIIGVVPLSLALLFVGGTISFGQETSPADAKKDASSAIEPAAAAVAQPAAEANITTTKAPASEAKPAAQLSDADMMKQMMDLAKTGENHKLLSGMAGSWAYTVKMWMNPSAPATTSTGTAVIKPIMDGRYFVGDFTSKMQMPGPDGKMKDMQFKGMSLDGYDNAKQRFVSAWCDSMGTGIMMSEGTYDASSKTLTYNGDYEAMPGMKNKVRMLVKLVDKDHHNFEFYEDRGSGESKTMEINYTRKK